MIVWREKLLATGDPLPGDAGARRLRRGAHFPGVVPRSASDHDRRHRAASCWSSVCDLALGPLISLVIYNSRKARRKLIIDYTIVGAVQIAALVYGVLHRRRHAPGVRGVQHGSARSRHRARHHRHGARGGARSAHTRRCRSTGRAWSASRCRRRISSDALFESLSGNEEHMRPKFYVRYETQLANNPQRAPRPSTSSTKRVSASEAAARRRDARSHDAGGARPLAAGSSSSGILDRADRHRRRQTHRLRRLRSVCETSG